MNGFLLVFLIEAASALNNYNVLSVFRGGNESEVNPYPYQLSMEKRSYLFFWNFHCGAAIVGPNHALTSARCVSNQNSRHLRFRAGTSQVGEGSIHYILNITMHPEFVNTFDNLDNDIAIVTVREPFIFGDSVKRINLVSYEPRANDLAMVTGWRGGKQPLQSVRLNIVERSACKKAYEKKGYTISERMICVMVPKVNKESCSKDNGSPLVVSGRLAGMYSWGFNCLQNDQSLPDVYSNLAYHKKWLSEHLPKSLFIDKVDKKDEEPEKN